MDSSLNKNPEPTTRQLDRTLWLILASAVIAQHSAIMIHTQTPVGGLLSVVAWMGALLSMEDRLDSLRPNPSWWGASIGIVLLLIGLLHSTAVTGIASGMYLLSAVLGLGLVLLLVPIRGVLGYSKELGILSLLPMGLLLLRFFPEKTLSEMTASMTAWVLSACGWNAQASGRLVNLGTSAVNVLGGCSGLDQLVQVLVVAVIFTVVFRMSSSWRICAALVLAPAIAVFCNVIRIVVLAIINDSSWERRKWWFDFFHEEYGGFLFTGFAVIIFGWLYLRLLDADIAAKKSRQRNMV